MSRHRTRMSAAERKSAYEEGRALLDHIAGTTGMRRVREPLYHHLSEQRAGREIAFTTYAIECLRRWSFEDGAQLLTALEDVFYAAHGTEPMPLEDAMRLEAQADAEEDEWQVRAALGCAQARRELLGKSRRQEAAGRELRRSLEAAFREGRKPARPTWRYGNGSERGVA